MRSTLFFIPHEINGIPLFGVGIVLSVLLLALVLWIVMQRLAKRPWGVIIGGLFGWGVGAALIVYVLPNIEQRDFSGEPIGLPIRGYGLMVLVGLLSGIGLTSVRGKKLGIAPDFILSLGFWMMAGGVIGARLFYVIQYWSRFEATTVMGRLTEALKLTEGGLVIYGGVIGGCVTCAWIAWKNKLPLLSLADLVAPGFLVGYSFGRIGCLLHGCCFGGICQAQLPTIQFPHGSGPYQHQIASGELLGLHLVKQSFPTSIQRIDPGSLADLAKIPADATVNDIVVQSLIPAETDSPAAPLKLAVTIETNYGSQTVFPDMLPASSLPVHPSQIYASINAALLCALVWFLQPIAKHDGIPFFTAIFLYGLSRFLLEWIRSDESGQFGTSLSISQLISIVAMCIAAIVAVGIKRRPAARKWDWANA